MEKDYQLLVTDMDGSALNGDSLLSPRTKDAMARAAAAGKDVAVCTGRGLDEALPFVWDIPGFRYVVCANGSCVYDIEAGKMVLERTLTPDAARYIVDYAAGRDIFLYANTHEGSLTDSYRIEHMEDYWAKKYEPSFQRAALRVENVAEYYTARPGLKFYKINLFHRSGEARADTARILESAGLPLMYVFGDESNIEVSQEGADKGWALRELRGLLGVSKARTIYVGDSLNDIPAMAEAGLPVAMGNAGPEVKRVCREETADNVHDGVAALIEKYLL